MLSCLSRIAPYSLLLFFLLGMFGGACSQSENQPLKALLQPNETIIYQQKLFLPYLKKELLHLKLHGGNRYELVVDPETWGVVDLSSLEAKEMALRKQKPWRFVASMFPQPDEKTGMFQVEVFLHCPFQSKVNAFLHKRQKVSSLLVITPSLSEKIRMIRERAWENCREVFLNRLWELGSHDGQLLEASGTIIKLLLSRQALLEINRWEIVKGIYFLKQERTVLLGLGPYQIKCYGSNECKQSGEFWGGSRLLDHLAYGVQRRAGERKYNGQGSVTALVEWGAPLYPISCLGGISEMVNAWRFQPMTGNMAYKLPSPVQFQHGENAFLHATATAAVIMGRKPYNNSWILQQFFGNCHPLQCRELCPSEYNQYDPFGFKGSAPQTTMLWANGGSGFAPSASLKLSFSGMDSSVFQWGLARRTNSRGQSKPIANLFSVSMAVVRSDGSYEQVNRLSVAADDVGTVSLPILGAGNQPGRPVAHTTMNGIVVGTWTFPNGQENFMKYPIKTYQSTVDPKCRSQQTGNPKDDCVSPHGDLHKPDVMAHGTFTFGATSLSTPKVTALAAQLISHLPILKYFPLAIKAVIMASANSSRFPVVPTFPFRRHDYGAGAIDGFEAHRILSHFLSGAGLPEYQLGSLLPANLPSLGWRYSGSVDFEFDKRNGGRFRYKWPNGQPILRLKAPSFPTSNPTFLRGALTWSHPIADVNHPTKGLVDLDMILQRYDPASKKWIDQSYAVSFDNTVETFRHQVQRGKYRFEIILRNPRVLKDSVLLFHWATTLVNQKRF